MVFVLSSVFFFLATPLGVQMLLLTALVVFFFLIVQIESVVLQLLKWGDGKSSWWASFRMNLVSAVVVFFCLSQIPRLGMFGLLISGIFSIIVESLVLARLNRGETRYAWLAAGLANLASFLVLLLPTYLFSLRP